MRKTTVQITCDNCSDHIVEGDETSIVIVIDGNEFNSDWCTSCAQALSNKLRGGDTAELTCHCGFVGKTVRGLALHRTRKGH